jgi:subtilisin-like proprotein convertase family protein
MGRGVSFWIRAALAGAVPAALLAPAPTSAEEDRAPCPPVAAHGSLPPDDRKEASQQWSIGEPTAEEQQILELMNRARLHPAEEGDRIFVDYGSARVTQATDFFLSQRPGVEFTREENRDAFHAYPARPPFAMNAKLTEGARTHTALMRQYDQQSHLITDDDGVPIEPDLRGRVDATGYSGGWLGESVYAYASDMVHAHAGFAVDFGQPVPTGQTRPFLGHRLNLMNPDGDLSRDFREVGVGVLSDTSLATTVGPRLVTIDFAVPLTAPDVFVTGVAYEDLDADGFYDPGEGLGGVRVDLDVGDHFAVTSTSGGYAVPVFGAPGTVRVTATGQPGTPGQVVLTQSVFVDVTTASVKVDFTRPPDPPVPPMLEFASAAPTPIADPGSTSSTIDVPAQPGLSDLVGDVEIEVAIDHPAREELSAVLVAPGGLEISLFLRGAPGADLRGVFDATLTPEAPLAPLVGGSYVGTWTLRVDDAAPGNGGVLESWKLRVRPQWVRTLFAAASPLSVTRFALIQSKRPSADAVVFKALVDTGRVSLGELRDPLLRIRAVGGAGAVLFSTPLPATSVKRAVRGTSKTAVAATVRKLELPDLSAHAAVTLELALDDAVVAQTVRLVKGVFNGAPAGVASPMFRVDALTTRIVKGLPIYVIRGRFASPDLIVGIGTLDVSLGALRLRERMATTKKKGRLTTFAGAAELRALTVDPLKGTFAMTVLTAADVRSGGTAIDVSLRLGENGLFGATSVVPAGSASSPIY